MNTSLEPASPLSPAIEEARQARALRNSARPLIALATQLRRVVPDSADAMKAALASAVDRFEREVAAAGWDERRISAASYLLCAWVDEVVADTPWGSGGAGLLERFHAERDGGGKVLRLLSRLAEQPRENRALLELFHACLSLGLTGPLRAAPDAVRQLEQLRSRVYLALPHDAVAISPPWGSAVAGARSPLSRRLALGALVLLGLVALAAYTSSHLLLAARVDQVFAAMRQLSATSGSGPADSAAVMPANAAAVTPRLAPLLASDQRAGLLAVRDEAHRSVVAVPAEILFEPGQARLSASGAALLARLGATLATTRGKVLVIGHTDGSDPRTARLPSAWHQSYEWARATADALGRSIAAERLAVEAAADLDTGAGATRRRVEVVLYP